MSACLYFAVGEIVRRRRTSQRYTLANTLFAVWWYTLATHTVIGAAATLATRFGFRDVPLYSAIFLFQLLIICSGLAALLFYFLFLFSGRQGLIVPLGAAYLLYYFLLVYWFLASGPIALQTTTYGFQVLYEAKITGWFFSTILVLLIFPQIFGALAFFTLAFRVEGREQKFRITLVSWAIIVWFGISFVGNAAQVTETVWWQFTSRILGLTAAAAIWVAYATPRFLRRWLGVPSQTASDAGAPSAA